MNKPRKNQVEDEAIEEEELESELSSEPNDETSSVAGDVSADLDDLIGEPESSELEQTNEPGPDVDAAGKVEPVVEENTPEAPQGWLSIVIAPRSGTRVILSDDGTFVVKAFWHRTRRFDKGRWQMNGKWRDAVTGKDMNHEPRFWRELRAGE